MTAAVGLSNDRAAVAMLEDVAICGGNVGAKIVETFDVLAEASGGVAELRRVILALGMQGRLTGQRRVGEASVRSVEDAPFEIPASWRWARLEEVATYNAGERMSADSIPAVAWLLDLEDVEKATSRLLIRMRAQDRRSKSTKSSFCRGDVLYGKLRPYLDKVLVADEDGFCTTEIAPVRPGPDMDSQFLRYALKRPDFLMYVSARTYGINLPRLSAADARAAWVPVPPLAEQTHIVAKIDQLMALCDDFEARRTTRRETGARLTKASLEALTSAHTHEDFEVAWRRVSDNFDVLAGCADYVEDLRRAVLELAVCGRLVQNETKESAADLLRRIAETRRERKSKLEFEPSKGTPGDQLEALPPTWQWCQVGDVATVCLGGTPARDESRLWGGEVPWVSSGEVANCRISTTRETLTKAGLAESNAKLYPPGTVLIAMIGQGKTRGQSAILDIEAATNQNVAGLVFDAANIEPSYVWIWALSEYARTRAEGRGGAQPALNGKLVRGLWLPLPPLTEQKRIVVKVEQLMATCDLLEANLHIAEGLAAKLTNAIVQELVA